MIALTQTQTNVTSDLSGGEVLRQVGLEDLERLAALDNVVFGTVGYPRFVLRQFYDLFSAHCYVIEKGGDLCGYALVGITTHGDTAWLLGLAVDKRHRGHGFGKRLMDQALDCCRAAGVKEVKITVRPSNEAAVMLYEKAGFRECGSEPDYFGPQEERSVLHTYLPGAGDLAPRTVETAEAKPGTNA